MRLMLLGPLQLVDDAEERIVVTGPRQRILLAALAVHANQPVSLDALAEVVWDGTPRRAASRRCAPAWRACAAVWDRASPGGSSPVRPGTRSS